VCDNVCVSFVVREDSGGGGLRKGEGGGEERYIQVFGGKT